MPAIKTDLIGKQIGKLKVLSISHRKRPKPGKSITYFKCLCDCGTEVIRSRDTLVSKDSKVKSCGCYKKEFLHNLRFKHGMSDEVFHKKFLGMRQRILNPNNKKYKDYGGRGIKICDRWKDFINFKEDMYESYLEHVKAHGEKNTTLERKDVHGDYCPENCTWATLKEQNGNRQMNKPFLAINISTGEQYIRTNKSEFAKEVGIPDKHIGSVLNGNRKSTHGFTFKYLE